MKENEFKQFELSSEIIETLSILGYVKPTKIQTLVIPEILKENHIVAMSQTGSGKTAAFAIPLCERINWEENLPQALVLEPTRELAYQVKEEIFQIGRKKRLKVPLLYGGFSFDKQDFTLRQKSHIVVGTPGRVLEHLEAGTCKSSNIKYVVIDEADLMFDLGFLSEVESIIKQVPKDAKLLLFSATMKDDIKELVTSYRKKPVEIMISSKAKTVDTITQMYYFVDNHQKFELLFDVMIMEMPKFCMIFCGTRDMVQVLVRQLGRENIRCGMLHGLMEQEERIKVIHQFKEGKFRYLVTTDVAARGVDFEGITHVINYDLPTSVESYVHRIGRTGRNGKAGRAISFANSLELDYISQIEEYTKSPIKKIYYPDKQDVEARKAMFLNDLGKKVIQKKKRGEAFKREITTIMIGGGRKSKLRAGDIVGTICSIGGVEGSDIGIIDVRDSATYVEILNGKGKIVVDAMQDMTLKGKIRKVRMV